MKVKLLVIGKTSAAYLEEGIAVYVKRLVHYTDFSFEAVADVKVNSGMEPDKLKDLEAVSFLKKIKAGDYVVLLDERGKQLSSEAFAKQIGKWQVSGEKNVVFIVGGAYGFGSELKSRAAMSLSLSEMTFSHQMVRLIFVEQLYRAFTILKGEPYHHK